MSNSNLLYYIIFCCFSITKYRQLDADGKEEIDDIIDVKLAKLQRKAEEDVESLG